MRENDKKKLLSKIDIVEFIGQFVELKKQGRGYKGLSPFKLEKTPSFSVSTDLNIFNDFSSGKKGDVIAFYSYIKNISYRDAFYELADRYGVEVEKTKQKEDPNKQNYELLFRVCKYYESNIENTEEALSYMQNRGYSLEDIKEYRIGYSKNKWNDLYNNFENEDDKNRLIELGYLNQSEDNIYDVFRNRIMFPIFNLQNKIVGFGARDISNLKDVPKYINSQESKLFKKGNELFGIFDSGNIIKKYDSCILVEGFFDVLTLHKNNIKNVVASLGTALTENQVKLLRTLTKNVVISYDDDSAGLDAKIRAIHILNKYDFNIKVASLDNLAKDPDELIQKYGRDKFVELFSKSKDAFDFLFDYYLGSYDISQMATKEKLIKDLTQYFSSIVNEIYYHEYLNRFAKKLDIEESILKTRLKSKNSFKKQTPKKPKQQRPKEYYFEENTIGFLLNFPKFSTYFEDFDYNNDVFQSLKNLNYDREKVDDEARNIIMDLMTKRQFNENMFYNIYKDWVCIYYKKNKEKINIGSLNPQDFNELITIERQYQNREIEFEQLEKLHKKFKEFLERNL